MKKLIMRGMLVLSWGYLFAQQPEMEIKNAILFVGDGCSHCAQIKKFLTVVDLSTGINVEMREVYHDAANAQYFTEIADSLEIASMER